MARTMTWSSHPQSELVLLQTMNQRESIWIKWILDIWDSWDIYHSPPWLLRAASQVFLDWLWISPNLLAAQAHFGSLQSSRNVTAKITKLDLDHLDGGNSTIWMEFSPFSPWGFMIQFDEQICQMGLVKNHQLATSCHVFSAVSLTSHVDEHSGFWPPRFRPIRFHRLLTLLTPPTKTSSNKESPHLKQFFQQKMKVKITKPQLKWFLLQKMQVKLTTPQLKSFLQQPICLEVDMERWPFSRMVLGSDKWGYDKPLYVGMD